MIIQNTSKELEIQTNGYTLSAFNYGSGVIAIDAEIDLSLIEAKALRDWLSDRILDLTLRAVAEQENILANNKE